ncbi:hypothetical protein VM1G_04701 [Cytospora mali]|uniref:Uncharacterized protein n=1 Tax=Cytospora mali TaxID=578113 RepID=A0A194VXL3_CYTMA|nr:hypothetical protein VM1G_04701 [Valsa mali]
MHTNFANHRDRVNLHRYQPGGFDDVSPPSSPELPAYGDVPNHDISPIDEEDDFTFPRSRPNMSSLSDLPSQQRSASRQANTPSPNARSNIPMMRRERRQLKDAEAAGRARVGSSQERLHGASPRDQSMRPMGSKEKLRQPSPVPNNLKTVNSRDSLRQPSPVPLNLKPVDSRERLRQPSPVPQNLKAVDSSERLRQPTVDYSQKPGSSNGRPRGEKSVSSQVKSLEHAHGLGVATMTAEKRGTSPIPPKSPSMGSKQNTTSDTDPAAAAFTSNRPGWRGASGRTALVEPVKDNPTVAPLRLPTRSNKRVSLRLSEALSPSPSPGPSPSAGGVGGGVGGRGRDDGQGGPDIAMPSPPISPQNQLKNQDQQSQQQQQQSQQQQQQPGGGIPAGRRGGVASSMANTFRKFIPSSQRQPSNNGYNAQAASGNVTPQGYPSPPRSNSPTLPGGGSAAVNATANIDANASNSGVNADANPGQLPLQQQQILSAQPSPIASHPPIRRKRVGSGTPFANISSGNEATHQPKESFASSVYSQQAEANRDQQQRPSQEAAPRPIVNTANLPGAGNADSPYVQPPSRFSVTTYATSAYASTPRESLDHFDRNHYNEADAPPLPTPPKDVELCSNSSNSNSNNNSNPSDSVMDRSRPKLRSKTTWDDNDDEPVKISLSKPWMSMAGANSAGINTQSSPPRNARDAPRPPRELPDKAKDNSMALRMASGPTSTPDPPPLSQSTKPSPPHPPKSQRPLSTTASH